MTNTKSNKNNLKPCPFCGRTPIIKQGRSFEDDEIEFSVRCSNEYGCDPIPETNNHQTIDDAIAAWNTRHGEVPDD